MSDQGHGWGTLPMGTPPPVASAPAGWYPDPWSQGHHRYWDGFAWTSETFPHGPADLPSPGPSSPGPSSPGWADDRPEGREGADTIEAPWATPPAGRDLSPPPPPEWAPPSPYLNWGQASTADGWPVPGPVDEPRPERLSTAKFVALVVAVMLVVGSLGTIGGYYAFRHKSTTPQSASGAPTTPGTTPNAPTGPFASVLESLVLTQGDVPSTYVVQPIVSGTSVDPTAPTLNLCNGTYPSESLRVARLQVAAFDGAGDAALSTEAVVYTNPAATAQAFSELRSVVANCPSTPVVSPVGQDTVITQFNAAPDGSWPQTAMVSRQAYDLDTTDDTGTTLHSVAVYFRRGRVLMGVYFAEPDSPQVPVAGQSTIESIAAVFAGRIAKLPASVVNG